MFTPTVLILIAIIFVLLVLNGRLHLDLSVTREEAARWKTRGDNMDNDLITLQQRGMDFDRDLKRQQRAYDAEIQHLRHLVKTKNTELEGLRLKRSTLESVKFFARVPNYNGYHVIEAKLGSTPSGLVVSALNVTEVADRITIEMAYDNGERSTFDYFKSDIQGRIEKRWAA